MEQPLNPATRLKQAREAKGLSCRQLAETTRLSVRTIEALESARLSVLPEGIYRRAIVRSVASEVGLNPDQLLRDFSAAYPHDLPAPDSAVLVVSAVSERSRPKAIRLIVAVLPLLAAVAFFAWPSMRPAEAPASLASASTPAPLPSEIQPAGGITGASDPLRRPVVVILTISSRCQLRIVADGREILNRTVAQGERIPIELGDELWLTGDNPTAVQFSINGQAGRLLGETGDVLSVRIGRDDYQNFLARD